MSATERPIYIEHLAGSTISTTVVGVIMGRVREPVDATEEVWGQVALVPHSPPPLVANAGPNGGVVELVAITVRPVSDSTKQWDFYSYVGGAAPPGVQPPWPIARAIPVSYGVGYAPTLSGAPPYDGIVWVIDSVLGVVVFPAGAPASFSDYTATGQPVVVTFYRYTGTTAGGSGNTISAASKQATIGGGLQNTVVSSVCATVAGGTSAAVNSSDHATVGGGYNHAITSSTAAGVCSGSGNSIDASAATVICGGTGNTATLAPTAFIGGGTSNAVSNALDSAILGGSNGVVGGISAVASAIVGGTHNAITSSTASTVVGGDHNAVSSAANSAVLAGHHHNVTGSQSSVLSGDHITAAQDNTAYAARLTTLGGRQKKVAALTAPALLTVDHHIVTFSNTTGGASTLALPTSPVAGQEYWIKTAAVVAGTANNLLISDGLRPILGVDGSSSSSYDLGGDVAGATVHVAWSSAQSAWLVLDRAGPAAVDAWEYSGTTLRPKGSFPGFSASGAFSTAQSISGVGSRLTFDNATGALAAGAGNNSSGAKSVALGNGSVASGACAVALGESNGVAGDNSSVLGGTSHQASGTKSAILCGNNNAVSTGVTRSAVLCGATITASQDDTAYAARLTTLGGRQKKVTTKTSAALTASATLDLDDHIVEFNNAFSGATLTLHLPAAPVAGQEYWIKIIAAQLGAGKNVLAGDAQHQIMDATGVSADTYDFGAAAAGSAVHVVWSALQTKWLLLGGATATIAVGSVTATTGAPSVTNSGTSSAALLDFALKTGATGAAATVTVGSVTTGAPLAISVQGGTANAAVLDFTIPGDLLEYSAGTLRPNAAAPGAAPTTANAVLTGTGHTINATCSSILSGIGVTASQANTAYATRLTTLGGRQKKVTTMASVGASTTLAIGLDDHIIAFNNAYAGATLTLALPSTPIAGQEYWIKTVAVQTGAGKNLLAGDSTHRILDASGVSSNTYDFGGAAAGSAVHVIWSASQTKWLLLATTSIAPPAVVDAWQYSGSTLQPNMAFSGASSNAPAILCGSGNTLVDNTIRSSIGGGVNNTVTSSSDSIICGGNSGSIYASSRGFVGGGSLNAINDYSSNTAVVSGSNNRASRGYASGIFVGENHVMEVIAGTPGMSTIAHSAILGGMSNEMRATLPQGSEVIVVYVDACSIVSGSSNQILSSGVFSGAVNTTIGGGRSNTATDSDSSFIGAGYSNRLGRAVNSFIGAGSSNTTVAVDGSSTAALRSAIVAGSTNDVSGGVDSIIGAGGTNFILGTKCAIMGGGGNQVGRIVSTNPRIIVLVDSSAVCSGLNNEVAANYAAIVAGSGNKIEGLNDLVTGVMAGGHRSLIGAGLSNTLANATCCAIVAGSGNSTTTAVNSVICAGSSNSTSGGDRSAVLCGSDNAVDGTAAAVVSGTSNAAHGVSSAILCGASNSIPTGCDRSAVLSGGSITASQTDTAYAQRLTTLGGRQKQVTVVAADTLLTLDHHVIAFANRSSGAVTITLPASPPNGQEYVIKLVAVTAAASSNMLATGGMFEAICPLAQNGALVESMDLGAATGPSITVIWCAAEGAWLQV